ncbi:hypothetical protein FE782_23955 [Paenibacillus antri]|uniref:Uncharacterized protein n=1 Tax=Paenibacillus antri TaxID=2582848 RepID=A0A5R9GEB7_9BACL|nr:hypothetical protein [Paenibacillus antri]TLS49725.1 hypothetical protein FE782_23955 [Paenibacillus antri]
MKLLARKIFSMGEIKHVWLLLLSVAICVVTFAIDERVNPGDQLWLSVSYFASFTAAAAWAAANYVGHLRMNRLLRKQTDIGAYVDQLALSADDRQELRNYLEDFAADLERQGRRKEDAAKEAITQFKVKELLSMSKYSSPFETHGHHYLLGLSGLTLTAAAAFAAIGHALPTRSLFALIATTVAAVYGFCFLALFFLYKVMDNVLYRKVRDYFG